MHLNYLALAVPFFLFFMIAEFLIAKRLGRPLFTFANAISNINTGVAERMLDVFATGAFYFVYDYLYRHFAIWHFKPTVFHWILLLLLTDFVWYWYHRLGHEINIFWAVHVVHHQSDDFNYTVSARITIFQAIVRTGFWAIMPVAGFTAPMITTMLILHGLYPFFIHTQLIGKMGILEYIFVTPSHHRVHHASNPEYLDKNYGDVLIIWDKLFGTFCKEKDNVVITYGLTKPLESHSFLWQQFHFVIELMHSVRSAKGWREKMALLFGKPDAISPEVREIVEAKFHIRKNKLQIAEQLNRYVLWQVVLTLFFLFGFILLEKQLPVVLQIISAGLIFITLVNCGAILEQKKWIFYLEYARYLLLFLVVLIYFPNIQLLSVIALLAFVITCFFHTVQNYYLKVVYRVG